MDALSATTASVTQAVMPAAAPPPLAQPAAPAPPASRTAMADSLPALPAAVQRTQLDLPAPKLMTREQMAALLALIAT